MDIPWANEMRVILPSLCALHTRDGERLRDALDLLVVRQQVAVVRAFADELERMAARGSSETLRPQLVEELARLGCRILEAAATMSDVGSAMANSLAYGATCR